MRCALLLSFATLAMSSTPIDPPADTAHVNSVEVDEQGVAQEFGDSLNCPSVSRQDLTTGTSFPSPAPSTSIACTQKTSNARGSYSSVLAPCVISFHKSEDAELEFIDYQTSNLCSKENGFLTIEDYVHDWRDECVGDFSRCYSMDHHRLIVFDSLCAMVGNIPDGTTHVSVDCTEDKELILQAENMYETAAQYEKKQEQLDKVELKLINTVIILGSCLACIYVVSRWIIRPLVAPANLELDASQQLSQTQCSHTRSCQCGRWTVSQHSSLDMANSDDNMEGDNNSESSESQDFDMQVPADFDAIPIVAATVLPDFH